MKGWRVTMTKSGELCCKLTWVLSSASGAKTALHGIVLTGCRTGFRVAISALDLAIVVMLFLEGIRQV